MAVQPVPDGLQEELERACILEEAGRVAQLNDGAVDRVLVRLGLQEADPEVQLGCYGEVLVMLR